MQISDYLAEIKILTSLSSSRLPCSMTKLRHRLVQGITDFNSDNKDATEHDTADTRTLLPLQRHNHHNHDTNTHHHDNLMLVEHKFTGTLENAHILSDDAMHHLIDHHVKTQRAIQYFNKLRTYQEKFQRTKVSRKEDTNTHQERLMQRHRMYM